MLTYWYTSFGTDAVTLCNTLHKSKSLEFRENKDEIIFFGVSSTQQSRIDSQDMWVQLRTCATNSFVANIILTTTREPLPTVPSV